MDPISNVDAIVLLLRQRLLERSRAAAAGRTEIARQTRGQPAPTRSEHLREFAAIKGVDDRQLGRALVQNVLAEHFGAEMINEPAFQQVVERVVETLQGEPEASGLLQRLVRELRSTP